MDADLSRIARRCSACAISKPLSEFGAHAKKKYGKRHVCKLCMRERDRVRRSDPVKRAREFAQSKVYRSRPEVKARLAAKHREYYASHQDVYQKRAYTRAQEFWSERLIYSARTASRQRRARGRDCPMALTKGHLEELWQKQNGLCHFTGITMTKDRHRLDTVSIDRLDPSKGYVPGNVVLATKAANFAKTGHSESEFREFLDRVADSITSARRIKSVA